MFSQTPKFDLWESLQPYYPIALVMILLHLVYLAFEKQRNTRVPGYFKRHRRESSFEEELVPMKAEK